MSELHSYDDTIHKVTQMTGLKPYLVGGAVRDALMGKPSKDIDLTVVGGHFHAAGFSVPIGWEGDDCIGATTIGT